MAEVQVGADRAEILDFITRQQRDAATATQYLDSGEAVEKGLDTMVAQWQDTLRVIRDSSGGIIGASICEWDTESKRAWVYGPWTAPHHWKELAITLVEAAISQVPAWIDDYELSADVANERMRWLAEQLGWVEGRIHFVYQASANVVRHGAPIPAGVRRATLDDLTAIQPLHDANFPATYLTASQCLAPDRLTLVATVEGKVVGYISGRPDPTEAGVLEFLAVDRAYRRLGIGRGLMVAAARELECDDLILSSADHFRHAWELFHGLGFSLVSACRAYRKTSLTARDAFAAGSNSLTAPNPVSEAADTAATGAIQLSHPSQPVPLMVTRVGCSDPQPKD